MDAMPLLIIRNIDLFISEEECFLEEFKSWLIAVCDLDGDWIVIFEERKILQQNPPAILNDFTS